MEDKEIPNEFRNEVDEFCLALNQSESASDSCYEIVESRFNCLKFFIRVLEQSITDEERKHLQSWFRQETDELLGRSRMFMRARTWPEGYPGDYITLEAVYANEPEGKGLARHVDSYFLTRTLAVAVRSRLRKLATSLAQRGKEEASKANWLNIACGPCRELLAVPSQEGRVIHCLDADANALSYAKQLLAGRAADTLHFHAENAFRLVNAQRNITRFGQFTTIYSAGLFDYLPDDQLTRLLSSLWASLASDGVLIAPFKDATRYETFDYHWCVKWDFFRQRKEADFRRIFTNAGIPAERTAVDRDESGVILFFSARR
jgi:hypothetical protein